MREGFAKLNLVFKLGTFPCLRELCIAVAKQSPDEIMYGIERDIPYPSVSDFEPSYIPNITSLKLPEVIDSTDELKMLSDKLRGYNLKFIDISKSCDITGNLHVFLLNSFPCLESLVLRDCELESRDLYSLAKANVDNKLPELKHLDISSSSGEIENLFANSAKWNQLLFLATSDQNILNVSSDCLCSLQTLELNIIHKYETLLTEEGRFAFAKKLRVTIKRSWPRILCLRTSSDTLLSSVADAVEQGLFPNLKTINGQIMSVSSCFRLLKAKIYVASYTDSVFGF